MTLSNPDTLALSRRVIRILIALNFLLGAFILTLLVSSLIAEGWVMRALGVRAPQEGTMLYTGMRMIMMIGLLGVPVVHHALKRLLAIVETVKAGNPFVLANAGRLQGIAWALLTLELMHIVVGIVGALVSTAETPLNMGWQFSPTRWLAVLMLFVLARVFEEGARMREDLEGTV